MSKCLALLGLSATLLVMLGCAASAAVAAPPLPVALFAVSPPVPTGFGGYGALEGLACLSHTECVALDVGGAVLAFDPASPGRPSLSPLTPDRPLTAAWSCVSAAQCTVVAQDGREITFDPSNPSASHAVREDGAPPASDDQRTAAGLTCPLTQLCTAVDRSGYVWAFNPLGPISSPPAVAGASPGASGPVACLSASQCIIVNGDREFAFDPVSGTATPPTQIDSSLDTNEPTGNPAGDVYVGPVSCPTFTQCTVMDSAGGEATFNPQSPALVARHEVDAGGDGVNWLSCPTATQCTVVDNDGGEVTFDPVAPQHDRIVIDPDDGPLIALACPSADQCTVIDAADNEVTFNPNVPSTNAPYVAEASLGGLNPPNAGVFHPAPSLSLDVLAGTSSPSNDVRTVRLTLPSGLRFAAAPRTGTGTGTGTITVTVQGRRVPHTTQASWATLTITLRTPAAETRLTISAPAITVASGLAKRLAHYKDETLRFDLVARTVARMSAPITLPLAPNPPQPEGVCVNGNASDELPITTSNPGIC